MRKKILVVDDNIFMVREAVEYFSEREYDVKEATNTDEALLVIERGFMPHVLMSDIVMPGSKDGIDLVKIVQRRWPLIKSILVTGWLDSSQVPINVPVIMKPYDLDNIRKKIEIIID